MELYAAAAGFNVYGFLGYDVLFQFDPFRFIANLYGGIALREETIVIAGINISAQLSGPNAVGRTRHATLTILFFRHRRRLPRHLGRSAAGDRVGNRRSPRRC